ncbi:DUF4286 family protein [Bizionia sediminis]|uniref:DUF4286 family protein n=1 Tax=Bizionia sediminis TaxID=1737064 RepID=A0ABW5KV04_9FLAO
MIIYNVTINIDTSVHDNWLTWLKTDHIPKVLATGHFSEAKLTRVLVTEDMGGITYSVQYRAHSRDALERYYKHDADKLQMEGHKKFADKMLAFRTELEVIEEFQVAPK